MFPARSAPPFASEQQPRGAWNQVQTILDVLNSTLVSPLAFTVK